MTKRVTNSGRGSGPAKPAMPWPTTAPRAREEWDYHVQMLHEDEVAWCHEYELQRMLLPKFWMPIIERFRNGCPAKSYDAYFQGAIPHLQKPQLFVFPERFFTVWPEWPAKPYLTVPIKERKRRIGDWTRQIGPEMMMQVGLNEILAPYIAEIRRLQAKPDDTQLKFLKPADLEVGETMPDLYDRIVAFKVNDFCSDKEFSNMTLNWFRADQAKRGIKPVEKRGAAADTKKMRADLCAVGFWRLVRSGLSPTQVVVYTTKVSGKPIISDHKSAWSRAMARVKKLARWSISETFSS